MRDVRRRTLDISRNRRKVIRLTLQHCVWPWCSWRSATTRRRTSSAPSPSSSGRSGARAPTWSRCRSASTRRTERVSIRRRATIRCDANAVAISRVRAEGAGGRTVLRISRKNGKPSGRRRARDDPPPARARNYSRRWLKFKRADSFENRRRARRFSNLESIRVRVRRLERAWQVHDRSRFVLFLCGRERRMRLAFFFSALL